MARAAACARRLAGLRLCVVPRWHQAWASDPQLVSEIREAAWQSLVGAREEWTGFFLRLFTVQS